MGYRALLGRLASAGIDFVVVGGVGAVLQGVPTTTFDLDIVHARDAENRRRLHDLLASLEARYRQHLPRILTPTLEDLDSDGHLLLVTSEGPLDVLGTVTGGRRYEDLVEHSSTMTSVASTPSGSSTSRPSSSSRRRQVEPGTLLSSPYSVRPSGRSAPRRADAPAALP